MTILFSRQQRRRSIFSNVTDVRKFFSSSNFFYVFLLRFTSDLSREFFFGIFVVACFLRTYFLKIHDKLFANDKIVEMKDTNERIKSHEVRDEKFDTKDRRLTSTTGGKRKARTGDLAESGPKPKTKIGKTSEKIVPTKNETRGTVQALLLALSVLLLSYHGFRYGRTRYSVLDNGNIVNGYVSARRAVITFSLGYSVYYSFLSCLAASMLLYSIATKKPRWSLPAIFIYMADLVCHVADALVAFWLFFSHLKLSTALLYTTGTTLVISGELWIWLGVLRLYEQRTFA